MTSLPHFRDVKSRLDGEAVRDLLSVLGYEVKGWHFRLRDERTPSASIRRSDGYIKDFGDDFGGDIFDLLQRHHEMTPQEALEWVSAQLGVSGGSPVPIKRKPPQNPKRDDAELSKRLAERATPLLQALPLHYPKKWGETIVEIDGKETPAVWVAPPFEKLFEGYLHPGVDPKVARYIFEKVVGWDDYYECPAIVIRDESEKVVDIILYRPKWRIGTPPKYFYTKAAEKPSAQSPMPFMAAQMRLIQKKGYALIGEGVKDSLIATLHSIPFVGLWSASRIDDRLISLLKSERFKGVKLLGALDGDRAGENAFKALQDAGIALENLWPFDSGQDFGDWVRKGRSWD